MTRPLGSGCGRSALGWPGWPAAVCVAVVCGGIVLTILAGRRLHSRCAPPAVGDALRDIRVPSVGGPIWLANMIPVPVLISIDRFGSIAMDGTPVSVATLRKQLALRWKRHGRFLVCLAGDVHTSFRQIWDIVETCTEIGLPEVFCVVSHDTEQWRVAVPLRAFLAQPYESEPGTSMCVVGHGVYVLAGAHLTPHEAAARLASGHDGKSVIVPSEGATHGEIVGFLALCYQYAPANRFAITCYRSN